LGNNVWVVGWGVVRFAKPLIVKSLCLKIVVQRSQRRIKYES